ncbi:transglutaminase-like domain-containing protein [Oligella urethralis]|uniref:transglutaminase-like domain-containing protein n=1 Tax=Oligella urethralis TaxID=90245 RepID=UPI0024313670|nr:transglutaminase-like domain-containing protein [Oligella urethralis]
MISNIKRRDFFKVGAASSAILLPNLAFAATTKSDAAPVARVNEKERTFEVTLNHQLQEAGKVSKLWVPLPLNSEYQQLKSLIQHSGNYDELVQSDFEIPTLFAQFSEHPASISSVFTITTQERNTDFSKVNYDDSLALPAELAEYLEPTRHIQIDGIVKEKAEEITKGIKGDLERAKAIYTWVCNNMTRDESIVGCGVGDAKALLESGKLYGKCTDISSVFVALCRSVGIASREVFGIRVGESRFSPAMGSGKDGVANITGAQHCRAEFYLKGYGWIPCDPGDVTKVRLAEKLSNDDSKIVQLRDYLFGNWEMCWIAYNWGRDFALKPMPAEHPLNNFGYPYAEVDDNVQDYYSPKEFAYEYKSVEL